MKTLLTIILTISTGLLLAQGNFGAIQGKVFEKSDTEKPAAFATVWVQRGTTKFGTEVDENGRFKINSVPTGNYALHIRYFGDTLDRKITANVKTDGIANVGRINILENIQMEDGVDIIALQDPLIEFGDGGGITRIDSKDIMLSPVRNSPKQLIVSRNSDIKLDAEGNMMIRGARANDLVHFVDGVKTGSVQPIPSVAIGGITVYSSAIPAKYGDTTGGVIIMETKSYYDLWRAWKIRTTAVD
ncbi:MAG: carboxypeptidase-like regulatory domain-containing protein [Bacteroidota bacterium]